LTPKLTFEKGRGLMGEFHPPVVHFAVALSISGVLFEIFYLITKKPLFSSASLLNLLLAIKLLAFFRNSKGFKIAVLILEIAVTVAVVLQGRIGGKNGL
jgi:uncharacterized membrane protein